MMWGQSKGPSGVGIGEHFCIKHDFLRMKKMSMTNICNGIDELEGKPSMIMNKEV